jgi:hypothetical protein
VTTPGRARGGATRLAREITDRVDAAADRFLVARVSALALPRVTVELTPGNTVTIGRLASYTSPAVGDAALIAKTSAGWVALGKLATS